MFEDPRMRSALALGTQESLEVTSPPCASVTSLPRLRRKPLQPGFCFKPIGRRGNVWVVSAEGLLLRWPTASDIPFSSRIQAPSPTVLGSSRKAHRCSTTTNHPAKGRPEACIGQSPKFLRAGKFHGFSLLIQLNAFSSDL